MADWNRLFPYLPFIIGISGGLVLKRLVFTTPELIPYSGPICIVLFAIVYYFLISAIIFHAVGGNPAG